MSDGRFLTVLVSASDIEQVLAKRAAAMVDQMASEYWLKSKIESALQRVFAERIEKFLIANATGIADEVLSSNSVSKEIAAGIVKSATKEFFRTKEGRKMIADRVSTIVDEACGAAK